MTISRRVFLSTGGRAAAALAVRPPLRAVDRGREQFALDHTDFEKLRASIKGALILPSDHPTSARGARGASIRARTPTLPDTRDGLVDRHLFDEWLSVAERKAELPKLDGSLWHAYRRKWPSSESTCR